ncbi:MAG TPA: DUF2950 domain-containing protein [Thermoanaerobaculia bacterium]
MKTWYRRTTLAVAAASILIASASMPAAAADRKAYPQPQAAVDDFVAAIREYDLDALLKIFGADARRLFVSEDPVADKNLREEFLRRYDEKHELAAPGESERTLLVGADAWPLPIPLVRSKAGWTFDTATGMEEIVNRRVGRNELSAIQTCLAVGDAQREYFQNDHDGDGILEYAQSFRSSPGHQDGLYWRAAEGEPQSPLGEFVAMAADEGYEPANIAYHGYRFRLLTPQSYMVRGNQIGGFAVVAFPAAYGDSGVMTFMMSQDGTVYQKDLGERTEAEVFKMESFNPAGWKPVDAKDREIIPELDD